MAVTAPLAWADLTPDSAFGGGDGFVTENFSTSDMGTAVVTSDTRIYAVQEEGTDTIRVLVYTLAGDLDTSYGGGDGIAEVALATVADIELLPSGKVLLAGDRISKTPGRVIRLTANGSLDGTFSSDGVVALPYEMGGLAIDSNGRIVAAGTWVREQSLGYRKSDFGVARIRGNGTLDPNFSGDGKSAVSFDLVDELEDVTVDGSDRPVLVGSTGEGVYALTRKALITRFKAGGAIDGSFSGDGKTTATLSMGQNAANSVGIGAKNRVIVAMSNQEKFGGVRLLAKGSPDTNYSGDGKVAGNHEGSVYAAAVINGTIIVTGAGGASFDEMLVGGVTANGALNTAFGTGGKTSYNLSASEDFGWAVTKGSAGQVLVAGLSADGVDNDFLLARLLLP